MSPIRKGASTNGAVAVGVVLEVRLEDRFQHELGGGLYYPILDGRRAYLLRRVPFRWEALRPTLILAVRSGFSTRTV
jgi:hypothetical protein